MKERKEMKERKRKTIKNGKRPMVVIKNKTPKDVLQVSNEIEDYLSDTGKGKEKGTLMNIKSYSPSINNEMITLKSIPREKLSDCNNSLAFQLKEPLRISVPGSFFGKYCTKFN